MKVVVFAGGVGTRLWPLSRKNTPKQFEKVLNDKSLLQLAVNRLFPLFKWEDIYISTGVQYAQIIRNQLPKLPEKNIILEPQMRDVGPAIGLVTAILEKQNPDEPIALLWSDHWVRNEEAFRKALETAEQVVRKDPEKLVLIGQMPRFGTQNLGYIDFGQEVEQVNGLPTNELVGFQYRPPLETAQQFFEDKHHTWNLGYFITTPKFLLSLYQKFVPNLYADLKKIQESYGTKDFATVLNQIYPTIEKIHFDNAILEKMDKTQGLVMPVDIGWSDVGTWEQLKEALSPSVEENATQGKVLVEDSKDSLVFNTSDQLVVGIDLEGMLVVNTGDVILVCPKNSVPKIKKVLAKMVGTENEKLT